MSAYVIAEIIVHDPVGYEKYRAAVGKSLADYGAKFMVRGGDIEILEGSWNPKRMVMCEFPDSEAVRKWYVSDEYKQVKKLRDKSASFNMVLVEGV